MVSEFALTIDMAVRTRRLVHSAALYALKFAGLLTDE
jgi:hypothetical protein